jgi:hypothetical protein
MFFRFAWEYASLQDDIRIQAGQLPTQKPAERKGMDGMKATTRIYLDAMLQNIKSVSFFTFLGVLIARLGASDFQIALSNSLPAFFCALSLAFLTRQLPVTRSVFLVSGYVRQFAFICMALSILLPNPFPFLFFFWSINAISVIVTSAQQPAILRRCVPPDAFPALFSRNKMIAIFITTAGSFLIGHALDATDAWFPYNYVASMLIGCLSTFTGMALIAELAPREKVKLRFTWVRPFQECDRRMWWMALNNTGIYMAQPLFTIYHVKTLHLTNSQIASFVVTAGLVSAVSLPFVRRLMERVGAMKVYSAAIVGMIVSIIPYGYVNSFGLLIVLQTWIGLTMAVTEVASQTVMMRDAEKHNKEMAYFSDFQLVMHLGNALGPLAAGALLAFLPLWAAFVVIAVLRLLFFASYRLLPDLHPEKSPKQQGISLTTG